MKANRLGKEYSAHDLKKLRAWAKKGLSARVVAQRLKRSRAAVAFKAMTLGVSFHAVRQPAGSQRKALRTRRKNERARIGMGDVIGRIGQRYL